MKEIRAKDIRSDLKMIPELAVGWLVCRILSFSKTENRVVFSNFSGKCYADNPRYISEKLHDLRPDIPICWLYYKGYDIHFPEYVHAVKWPSAEMVWILCTSRVWVDSHNKPLYIFKNRKQYYIETWHGGLGMKKIEQDARTQLNAYYLRRSLHNMKMADLFISNCGWLSDLYRRAFQYRGAILECGFPKNDIFFQDTESIRKKVHQNLNIGEEYSVLMYAPTFRLKENESWFDIDLQRLHDAVEKKTGRKWKILVRLHPVMAGKSGNLIPAGEDCMDVSEYPDMQELILATDLYITDYSSGIFDYSCLRRPGFLYASDLDAYVREERELYWDMEELPFPYARNNDELIRNIMEFDRETYQMKLEKFFRKVRLRESGNAAEIIAKRIITILDGERNEACDDGCIQDIVKNQ